MKKRLAIILLSSLLLVPIRESGAEGAFKDLPANGDRVYLEYAIKHELLQGDGGYIRPDDSLTRAELATIVNRVLAGDERASLKDFKDVKKGKWYYEEMEKALATGIFKGADGRLKPEDPISREEAFLVMARVFDIGSGNEAGLNKFKDQGDISSWSRREVAGLAQASYIHPDRQGMLNPKRNISRLEYAELTHRLLGSYERGERLLEGLKLEENMLINYPHAQIKNTRIKGDLLLTEGVARSKIRLENLDIDGRLLVRGRPQIELVNVRLKDLVVLGKDSGMILDLDKNSSITSLRSDKPLVVEGYGKIDKISLNKEGNKSTIKLNSPTSKAQLEEVVDLKPVGKESDDKKIYRKKINSHGELEELFDSTLVNYPNHIEFEMTEAYFHQLRKPKGGFKDDVYNIFKKSYMKNPLAYLNYKMSIKTYPYIIGQNKIKAVVNLEYNDLKGGTIPTDLLRKYDGLANQEADRFVREELAGRGLSDPEKVLKINNYLVKRASYNYEGLKTYNIEDHIAYGVLVKKKGVCESYSKAFKLIADKAGLKSVYVIGRASHGPGDPYEDHAWNMVELDGSWYSIDTTWNDQGDFSSYDYFLKGDREINQTHKRDGRYSYPEGRGGKDYKKILNLK